MGQRLVQVVGEVEEQQLGVVVEPLVEGQLEHRRRSLLQLEAVLVVEEVQVQQVEVRTQLQQLEEVVPLVEALVVEEVLLQVAHLQPTVPQELTWHS